MDIIFLGQGPGWIAHHIDQVRPGKLEIVRTVSKKALSGVPLDPVLRLLSPAVHVRCDDQEQAR